jgi:Fe-S oxidoreductase
MAEVEKPDDLDVLYWVGCAGSFDDRNQRVSRAFATLMKQAGVRFQLRQRLTYHDPCYMARHNRKWHSARELDGPLAWMNNNRLVGLTELPVKAFPR